MSLTSRCTADEAAEEFSKIFGVEIDTEEARGLLRFLCAIGCVDVCGTRRPLNSRGGQKTVYKLNREALERYAKRFLDADTN